MLRQGRREGEHCVKSNKIYDKRETDRKTARERQRKEYREIDRKKEAER